MEAASQPQEQQGGGELDEADCEFDTQTPDCNNEITHSPDAQPSPPQSKLKPRASPSGARAALPS